MKLSKITLYIIILSLFTACLAPKTAKARKDEPSYHYNVVVKAQDLHTPYVRYSMDKILSESPLLERFDILVKSQKVKIKTILYKGKKSKLEEEIYNLLVQHKFTVKEVKAYKIR